MSCYRPKLIRQKGELISVACGHCPPCCFNKMAGWTFRLLQEERYSTSAQFLTLTYATNNLILTPYGQASICTYDLQNFFKRLRRRSNCNTAIPNKIKYYAVGEYGSQTKRPHYHIILFNADIELIEKAWTKGSVYYGDVSAASVGYTLKYLNKKSFIGKLGDDDRHPQFTLSSNGLGLSYLNEKTINYHLADMYNRNYITMSDGIKCAMPRYYYERIYDGYNRDLLKMSGSLIRQDKFYTEFISKTYEQRVKDVTLFEKRVDAAFRRHDYQQSKTLLL